MNSDVVHSIVQMEPKVLEQLMTEVKETVATDVDFAKVSSSSFSIVDLWNIRKNRKPAGSLRRKVNITTGLSY